jgi:SAM-dependent methyltransferase
MTIPKGRKLHRGTGMPAADRECWTRLYAGTSLRAMPWFAGRPYPPLVRSVEEGAFAAPGQLLDVGCGLGTNSLWLASRGFRVTGVDIAPGAIAAAQARRAFGGHRVMFLEDDILASALPSTQFHYAVDIGCFQTLPLRTRNAYVESLARVLRPQATFLLYWVAREETGSWGPPHRLSVSEVVDSFEARFLVQRIEYRPRRALLTRRIKRSRRPLATLAGYTAWLIRRQGRQPPRR